MASDAQVRTLQRDLQNLRNRVRDLERERRADLARIRDLQQRLAARDAPQPEPGVVVPPRRRRDAEA